MPVAPPAGAWIETFNRMRVQEEFQWSRPLRARGLKLDVLLSNQGEIRRAPCGRVD